MGGDLELFCTPSSARSIIKWYKNNFLLSKANVIRTTQGIYIFNLDYTDLGVYRCTADVFGVTVESKSVQVLQNKKSGIEQKPQIGYPRKITDDYTVSVTLDNNQPQSVNLFFGYAAYPGVKCSWTFFSNDLTHPKYSISDYNRSLTIHDVTSSDGGTYIGTCVNSIRALSRVQRSTYISLYINYIKLVVPSFSYVTEPEGSQVYLTCGCDGFQIPSVTWYKNNKRLLPSSKISQLFYAPRSVISIISIPSVTRDMSGLYHCTCQNNAGIEIAYFKLYIIRKSHCPAEWVDTEVGVFYFPETKVGSYVEIECPYSRSSNKEVQRLCNPSDESVKWTPFNYHKCPHPPITKKALKTFSVSPKSTDWILQSMIERSAVIGGERSCDWDNGCDWVIEKSAETVQELFEQIDVVEHLMLDRDFPDSLSTALRWLDHLLQINITMEEHYQDLAFHRLSELTVEFIKLSTDVYRPLKVPSNFGYYTLPVKLMKKNVQIQAYEENYTILFSQRTANITSPTKHTADTTLSICDVIISEASVRDLKMSYISDTFYFIVFSRTIMLFGEKRRVVREVGGNDVQVIGSFKVSAGLLNNAVKQTKITLKFSTIMNGASSCVYWNYINHGNEGNWATKGLVTNQNGSVTSCTTNHFTNFAVLMTLDRRSLADGLHLKVITLITLVSTTISCLALLVTIIVLISFKHLRTVTSNRLHINLSVSLLIASLTFITCFERLLQYKTPCLIVTLTQHYLWLTVFGWMCVEGLHLYRMVYSVFVTQGDRYVTKLAVIVWGTPVVIVSCVFGYWREKYVGYNHCWLDNSPMLFGFIGPVACSLLLNIAVFISVLIKSQRRSSYKNYRNNAHKVLSKTKGVLTIMCLLGITWLFGFLSIKQASLTFQYIFNICTALQGLCIFVFHCIVKHEVRASWSYFLRHGRVMSSEAQNRRGTAFPTMKPYKRSDQSILSVESSNTQSTDYSRNTSLSTMMSSDSKEEICIPYMKTPSQTTLESDILQNYILTQLGSLKEEDYETYAPSPIQDIDKIRRTPITTKKKKATPFLMFSKKASLNASKSVISVFESTPGDLPREKLTPFSSTPHQTFHRPRHGAQNLGEIKKMTSESFVFEPHSEEEFHKIREAKLDVQKGVALRQSNDRVSRVDTTQVMKQLRMRKASGSSTKIWREKDEETEVKMLDLTENNVGRSVSLNYNISQNKEITIKEEPEKIFQIIPGSMKRLGKKKKESTLKRRKTDY